jgi:hypothetical protein
VFYQFLFSNVEQFVSFELNTVFKVVSNIISAHTEKNEEEEEKKKEPTEFHTALR